MNSCAEVSVGGLLKASCVSISRTNARLIRINTLFQDSELYHHLTLESWREYSIDSLGPTMMADFKSRLLVLHA
jgi:hypothetical protein